MKILLAILLGSYVQYWEDIRGKLADILKVDRDAITADIFGDIRNLRHE